VEKSEITQFFAYVERTSRPDVWERRKRMARGLIEGKFNSLTHLVNAVDGNSRDRMWASQALKAKAIVRNDDRMLVLPEALEPETWWDRVVTVIWDSGGDDQMSDLVWRAARAAYELETARREQEES
jgi:hypothetical protein